LVKSYLQAYPIDAGRYLLAEFTAWRKNDKKLKKGAFPANHP
jgi:hypothetical protein